MAQNGDTTAPAHTRFSLEEWEALRKAAAKEDRSISSYVRRAVARILRAQGYLQNE